ncbi:MAG TPA: ABC transporter ATP-binding protein [Spirochaetota bacterium]|nr:ABC transporter ATP-binding protein [Spirochaetota bacterium]
MNEILSADDIHVHYGSSHVVQGISLKLDKGLLAIVGRNGMGKTTFVKSVMGLVPVTSGNFLFHGDDITNNKPYEIAMRGIGYVPQGRELFQSLTVDEHLQLAGREEGGEGWDSCRVYELFPQLKKLSKKGATLLSGGQQQMLAIGRALVTNPSLLIMDEPSEGLDPIVLESVIETCRELVRTGISILLIEQYLHAATSLADELHVMVSGRIVQKVNSEMILHDKKTQDQLLGVSVASE